MRVRNEYSAMGIIRIEADADGTKTIASGVEYNEFGQMTRVTRGEKIKQITKPGLDAGNFYLDIDSFFWIVRGGNEEDAVNRRDRTCSGMIIVVSVAFRRWATHHTKEYNHA